MGCGWGGGQRRRKDARQTGRKLNQLYTYIMRSTSGSPSGSKTVQGYYTRDKNMKKRRGR